MKLSIADLSDNCFPEDVMIGKEDAALTARVKARVLAEIETESKSAPLEESAETKKKVVSIRSKRIVTFALAAALLFSFGLVAYAIGSIHAARQQELKDDMHIAESHTASYVEYDVPEDQTDGLVLLSAINDGEFQTVYVNVSPVTGEQLARFPETWHFAWKLNGSLLDGEEWWGNASPRLNPDRSVSGHEEILAAILEDAYDAQTQTLTLRCAIPNYKIRELQQNTGCESVVLTVSPWDSQAQADAGVGRVAEWLNSQPSYGSFAFRPTEHEFLTFDFGHFLYRDEETGKEMELVSLELSPTSAVCRMRYDGAEEVYASRDQEKLIEWGRIEHKILGDLKIIFSDGEELPVISAMTDPFENGTINCYIGWERAVDIHDVQRIVLGNVILWENK